MTTGAAVTDASKIGRSCGDTTITTVTAILAGPAVAAVAAVTAVGGGVVPIVCIRVLAVTAILTGPSVAAICANSVQAARPLGFTRIVEVRIGHAIEINNRGRVRTVCTGYTVPTITAGAAVTKHQPRSTTSTTSTTILAGIDPVTAVTAVTAVTEHQPRSTTSTTSTTGDPITAQTAGA